MAKKADYRELGQEVLALAQRVKDPELRAAYLRLAASYDALARFRERVEEKQEVVDGLKSKS